MNIKSFLTFVMAACLLLALCACGNNAANSQTDTTAAPTTEIVNQPVDDGKVTYTVKAVDASGNPVANVAVQLCKETCLPGVTNAEGVVTFRVVEDAYKVSFMTMPVGFEADAEEFYFDTGAYELTITLKAVG